jgi:hypothetical protein
MVNRLFYLHQFEERELLKAFAVQRAKIAFKAFSSLVVTSRIMQKFSAILEQRYKLRLQKWGLKTLALKIASAMKAFFHKWPKYTLEKRHQNQIAGSLDCLTLLMHST